MIYDIIKERNLGALYRQINHALKKDFVPTGGVGYDGTWYFQGLIKVKKETTKSVLSETVQFFNGYWRCNACGKWCSETTHTC